MIVFAVLFYAAFFLLIFAVGRQGEKEQVLDELCRRKDGAVSFTVTYTGECQPNSLGLYRIVGIQSLLFAYGRRTIEFSSIPNKSKGILLSSKREDMIINNLKNVGTDTCIIFQLTDVVMDRLIEVNPDRILTIMQTQTLTDDQLRKFAPLMDEHAFGEMLEYQNISEALKIELQLKGVI